jgi:hypothetical protein
MRSATAEMRSNSCVGIEARRLARSLALPLLALAAPTNGGSERRITEKDIGVQCDQRRRGMGRSSRRVVPWSLQSDTRFQRFLPECKLGLGADAFVR